MVVQEDDTPVEIPVSKQSKKYVIVKNHVRELMPELERPNAVAVQQKETEKYIKIKNKKQKNKNQMKEVLNSEPALAHINQSDIEELRTIYKKCKEILKKMESKYGQLLDLDDEDCTHKLKKAKTSDEETGSDGCSCSLSKKIVFDENGQQIEKVCQLENHICPKKVVRRRSDLIKMTDQHIEYDQYNQISMELSENLQELGKILQDPNIDDVYRKMVIDKIYMKRQDLLYEMRNERKFLIEQLKENPDELLNFKGTNISTLPGYPMKPLDVAENKDQPQPSL